MTLPLNLSPTVHAWATFVLCGGWEPGENVRQVVVMVLRADRYHVIISTRTCAGRMTNPRPLKHVLVLLVLCGERETGASVP